MLGDFYKGKRVFVTGHTGFKGSWLTEWLLMLGARPIGYSLAPDTEPALFKQLGLEKRMHHEIGDIRNPEGLARSLRRADPDVVFHLAAQPLVRRSYAEPVATHETNVMGIVYLLDALRSLKKPCSVVVITSDKCYENQEWMYGYRETDRLGGSDPYSCSKACTELIVESYRRSFFGGSESPCVRITSARAGNVLGGGDWAAERIMPDCVRMLLSGKKIRVRNPSATRPWQHVLSPLHGYLVLAKHIYPHRKESSYEDCGAYNFGPPSFSNRTVAELVEEVLKHWPGSWEKVIESGAPHESRQLALNTDKAWHVLKWRSAWGFEEAVRQTVYWYHEVMRAGASDGRAIEVTQDQIRAYQTEVHEG
jgi:CDP-glucose 4,6-dehydratase